MSSASFSLQPRHALLLSLAIHGLLLGLPLPTEQPGGKPQVMGMGARSPLQVRLRPAAADPEARAVLHRDQADYALAPTEAEPTPEPKPELPPPGQDGNAQTEAYFPLKALTKEPEAMDDLQPQFPPLPGAGGRGQLTLRVWINAGGRVDRVEALSGTMTEAYRQPVLEAFARMGFRPGEIGGRPVGTWTDVVVEVPTGSP